MYQLFERRASTAPAAKPRAASAAARRALALCVTADALALEAADVMDYDEHRLLALLAARDEMLIDLAAELAVLRQAHRTADGPLFAATERAVDEAEAVLDQVAEALDRSNRVTVELTAKVAMRVESLRAELATVQRAGHAGLVYSRENDGSTLVDLRR